MVDHATFLRAIIAAPADDGPRLVFADWLEEQGEGDRAEFIRVQVRAEQLEAFVDEWSNTPGRIEDGGRAGAALAESQSLRRRERELLANVHSGDWLGALGKNGCTWPGAFDHVPTGEVAFSLPSGNPDAPSGVVGIFHRGFIESVTLSWSDWLAHADAIRAAQPVTRVRLTTWPPCQASAEADEVWFADFPSERYRTADLGLEIGDSISEALLPTKYPGVAFELSPPVHQPNADGPRGVMFPGTSVAATSTITYPEIPEPPPAAPRRIDNQANYSRKIEYGRRGRRR